MDEESTAAVEPETTSSVATSEELQQAYNDLSLQVTALDARIDEVDDHVLAVPSQVETAEVVDNTAEFQNMQQLLAYQNLLSLVLIVCMVLTFGFHVGSFVLGWFRT